ncbi:NADP-dependent 3-hydroxy acid dehydrogenase YdfG [Alteromonadaceae bacterium Bs31]|nr:NADP-dependent 3-hydroxy acid dehydrogenase YdfG [Alteromonadaceae bacterium Bs31]
MSKKILITGASKGFGLLTAHALLAQGHEIAASMREPHGRNAESAEQLKAAGAHIVEIDVSDEASVIKGTKAALESLNGLDVLVNNAGVGVIGIQETFTTADMQKVFDINVFGVHRMSRAVLPVFREQNAGLMVNVSSLLGRITIPFYGPYNATKWALEAMSENYRLELAQYGVDVALIEPGGFPTTFMDALIRPSDHQRISSYGEFANAPAAAMQSFEAALKANPQQDPQAVAEAIVSVIEAQKGQRPFRTTVDFIGMGEPINAYNAELERIEDSIYSAMGVK